MASSVLPYVQTTVANAGSTSGPTCLRQSVRRQLKQPKPAAFELFQHVLPNHPEGAWQSYRSGSSGKAAFSLQVLPMGTSLVETAPSEERDYLSLEQYYLDMYPCLYNARRWVGPASYTTSVVMPNTGASNPSYGLISDKAFAWNQQHSDEDRASWSKARGKTQMHVYDALTFEFVASFFSAAAFSAWAGGSKRLGNVYRTIKATTLCSSTISSSCQLRCRGARGRSRLSHKYRSTEASFYKANNTIVYGRSVDTGDTSFWTSLEALSRGRGGVV